MIAWGRGLMGSALWVAQPRPAAHRSLRKVTKVRAVGLRDAPALPL